VVAILCRFDPGSGYWKKSESEHSHQQKPWRWTPGGT